MYNISIDPVLRGDLNFGLGPEYVTPYNYKFVNGEKVMLNCTQNHYSFDYYEIRSPITVTNSSHCYVTYRGFTASFDPRTEVNLNYHGDIVGKNSLIIARYR